MHVVLYQPEIAYNTGSVGRTCVALGAKLWLVRPLGFQIDDKRLRRAGLDYWQHLDWEAVDDWDALCRRLPDGRRWFLSKTATLSYTEVGYGPDDVLVFGSESQGLPPSLLAAHPDRCLRVPICARPAASTSRSPWPWSRSRRGVSLKPERNESAADIATFAGGHETGRTAWSGLRPHGAGLGRLRHLALAACGSEIDSSVGLGQPSLDEGVER